MKRTIAMILSLLTALTILTGCGGSEGAKDTENAGTGVSQTEDASSGTVLPDGGNLKLMTPADVHNLLGFPATEGIYQCQYYNGQYILYGIDYKTHQKAALCSRSGCNHTDRRCDAWLPNYGAPFVIGDTLYLRCQPELFEDGIGPYYIQRRDLDGTNAENIWESDPDEMLQSAIAADDEYFYFFTVQLATSDDMEEEAYWNRVKISDGTRERVKKLDKDEDYDLVGAYGGTVLLFGFGGESGTDRAFFLMDSQTGEITPGFSYDGEEYCYQYLDGKTFYMVDIGENALKTVDLLSGEVQTVFPNLGLAEPQTARTLAVVDDRYVALYAYEAADNYYGQIVYSYAVDLEQQTIKQLEFRYDVDNGVTDPYQVLNALPNGSLLVKTGYRMDSYQIEDFGELREIAFEIDAEAFIPAEDFFNGVENFTPVEVRSETE